VSLRTLAPRGLPSRRFARRNVDDGTPRRASPNQHADSHALTNTGVPWTEDEHRLFLLGLQKLGRVRMSTRMSLSMCSGFGRLRCENPRQTCRVDRHAIHPPAPGSGRSQTLGLCVLMMGACAVALRGAGGVVAAG
jgi:hypothetical protein